MPRRRTRPTRAIRRCADRADRCRRTGAICDQPILFDAGLVDADAGSDGGVIGADAGVDVGAGLLPCPELCLTNPSGCPEAGPAPDEACADDGLHCDYCTSERLGPPIIYNRDCTTGAWTFTGTGNCG